MILGLIEFLHKLYMKQLVGPPFKEVLKTMSEQDPKSTTQRLNLLKEQDNKTTTERLNLLRPKSPGKMVRRTKETESISSLGAMLYRLACQFDIQECLTDALKKFNDAMTRASTAFIPEGLRGTVLCIGIRHGVEEFWLMVRDMYRESQEETEKRVLLNSLSCTTEYWALRKLLLWAIDRKVVPRSLTVGLLASVLKGYLGYYLGKQFLAESMDQILRRFNSMAIFSILKPFVETVTSTEELNNLESLFREKLSASMQSHINDLMESAHDKINWRKYQYYELLLAIKNYTIDNLE